MSPSSPTADRTRDLAAQRERQRVLSRVRFDAFRMRMGDYSTFVTDIDGDSYAVRVVRTEECIPMTLIRTWERHGWLTQSVVDKRRGIRVWRFLGEA